MPSTLGVSARTAAGASASVEAELGGIDALINSDYSALASTVFQDEVPLATAQVLKGPTVELPSSLVTPIDQAITSLQVSLTSAISGTSDVDAIGLIQAHLTGSSPGSLVNGIGEILAAGAAESSNAMLSPVSTNLLEAAIQGEIASSFTAATVEAYLFATGQGSHAATNVNFGRYLGRVNAAYGSFDSTITQAESALYLYPTFGVQVSGPSPVLITTGQVVAPRQSGTTPISSTSVATGSFPSMYTNQPIPADEPQAIATARDVVEVVDSQVAGLAQSLNSLVAGTSVASRAAAIQGQFVGTGSGLLGQLNSLLVAASSGDRAIPVTNLGLLAAAVDAAVNASYTSTAVEGSLLTSS